MGRAADDSPALGVRLDGDIHALVGVSGSYPRGHDQFYASDALMDETRFAFYLAHHTEK